MTETAGFIKPLDEKTLAEAIDLCVHYPGFQTFVVFDAMSRMDVDTFEYMRHIQEVHGVSRITENLIEVVFTNGSCIRFGKYSAACRRRFHCVLHSGFDDAFVRTMIYPNFIPFRYRSYHSGMKTQTDEPAHTIEASSKELDDFLNEFNISNQGAY